MYVGHHESFWDEKPKLNPITGKMEWNGTSILDIADPAKPKLVWHIPNDTNRNSRGVSVVYDYTFDGSGRDYLIRNSEVLTQGETGTDLKYQIFDITSTGPPTRRRSRWCRRSPARRPTRAARAAAASSSCARTKAGGRSETGYFYAASGEPGFRNVVVQIFDLKNPKAPKFVGRAWLPGLKDGEPGYEGQYSHHPIVDEENKRLYVGYRNAGGQAASFDISDPAQPKLVWSIDMNPPLRGPHTVSPIRYDDGAELRPIGPAAHLRVHRGRGRRARTSRRALAACGRPATCWTSRRRRSRSPVSVWQVPVGDFCEKGGRFGPHQSAETVNGKINRFEDKIAWIAYFNAGVRVVDLLDPLRPEGGRLLHPEGDARSHPMPRASRP